MKKTLSLIFYYLGDLISFFLKWDVACFFVYPVYHKLMVWSLLLDSKEEVWTRTTPVK